MALFGWFRKKSDRLYPEALWTVATDANGIRATDQTGSIKSISHAEPWGADFWWLLFGPDGQLACAFPQGATGEKEAMNYLMALPGFKNDELGKAIGTTDNAMFLVWKRAS